MVADAIPLVAGEVGATNAGVALVMIGTNDAIRRLDPADYAVRLKMLTDSLIEMGVVPILSTIPENQFAGGVYADAARRINQAIADVAGRDRLPLWNLWRGTTALPAAGLEVGGLHLSTAPAGGGDFSPVGLLYGQNLRSLEALQVLDWFREQAVAAPPEVVATSTSWTSLAGHEVYAVGRGEGQGPVVSVYDRATGTELNRVYAFDPSFAGGVRVAVADVNGDRVPDVIAAAGPGGGPQVKVFSGVDGSLLANVYAFDPAFRNGISSVAAADLDGDGADEVVVGAGVGGGPVVAVFHGGDFAPVQRFFAFDPSFRGGVGVAAGTFAGIGLGIAAAAGPGGGPVVNLFAYGSWTAARSFFAADATDLGGLSLAAGDFDGDGADEVAAGPLAGPRRVRVFDPVTGGETRSIPLGSGMAATGMRLAVVRGRGGEPDELLVGDGPGGTVSVAGFVGMSDDPVALAPTDPRRAYGIYVG